VLRDDQVPLSALLIQDPKILSADVFDDACWQCEGILAASEFAIDVQLDAIGQISMRGNRTSSVHLRQQRRWLPWTAGDYSALRTIDADRCEKVCIAAGSVKSSAGTYTA